MIPLIIECIDPEKTREYLSSKYYLQNLVSEIKPEDNSIGLPAIKFLTDRAKFSGPERSQSVYLIWEGHLITPAGQNALLKTLEESLPWQQFIITTHNHYLLLETVLSRCQLISLTTPDGSKVDKDFILSFVKRVASSSRCLLATDEILAADPEQYLDQLIRNLRTANQQTPTLKRSRILTLANECLSDLKRNINPKLTVDHFLLECGKLVANTLK